MSREKFDHDPSQGARPGILARLVRLNRYLLVLLIIPAGLIYFRPPLKDQEAASQRLESLTEKRDSMKKQAMLLEQKLDLIKNDADFLETMARDRLHLQKDGEVILRFEESAAK